MNDTNDFDDIDTAEKELRAAARAHGHRRRLDEELAELALRPADEPASTRMRSIVGSRHERSRANLRAVQEEAS